MLSFIAAPFVIIFSLFTGKPKDFIFWCKWIVSYIYIHIKRKYIKRRFSPKDINYDNDPYKVDFISLPGEITLESPLDESQLHHKSDEVFCYGVNSKSECLIVRVARGPNHEAEAWIYLKLDNGKVYRLKETSGQQQSCCDRKVFSCGALQMHYNTPMRIWRIFYNGLLSESDENDTESGKMVHVKFALRWRASSDVFDFLTDTKVNAIANGLARCKWTGLTPPFNKLKKSMNLYAQCGSIGGTIQIEGSDEDYHIYLFGERIRYTGDTSVIKSSKFDHLLGYTPLNGRFFHLTEISIENVVEKLTFGFVVHPIGEMCAITDDKIPREETEADNKIERKFHIEGTDDTYLLTGNKLKSRSNLRSKQGWDGKISIDCLDFSVNSFKCIGIIIEGSMTGRIKQSGINKCARYKSPAVVPLVVHFSNEICQDSSITGGKGSSLGKLTELSNELKNFIVPCGVVVTTSAYQRFMNKSILEEIRYLEDVLYGNKKGDIKEACQRVSEKIIRANMPEQIEDVVAECLQKLLSKRNPQFAVRSSATGEDTEDMSAAGQMETFLGVIGMSEILSSVKKCWASQFSYIAVQYKRQNGQVINSPMAVVIQEMIPCDVAGVLFTSDPLTGNPSIMSITANYGLGESVVSASEEPDTLELQRNIDNIVSIKNRILGAKKRRITFQVDKEGTNIEEVSEKEREKCCLSDDKALRLGNLAVQIERNYRSHRDIEWGFWNNNLYIFQSRPVTTGCSETDYEIDHEFDAPLRIENEYFTMANVGEVMPGALSPLGLDVLLKYFEIAFQRQRGTWRYNFRPRYFRRGLTSMYNHVMFYCLDLFERMDENKELNEGTLVALFGRIIEDEELFQTTRNRFGIRKKPFLNGLISFLALGTMIYKSRKVLENTLEAYSSYRIPVEKYKTSEEMFKALLSACTDLNPPMQCHMMNSQSSMIWNLFIFNILKKARGGICSEVYMDFAKLLTTSSDVESADVPAALEDLAHHISKEKKSEDLKQMNTKDIIGWLEKTSTSAGKKYREFLQKHGHRCLKEFDIYSKTWETDPSSLIKLIRNLVGNSSKNKDKKDTEDVNTTISNLGIRFGFKARLLLKYLIPQSRRSVQNREASKSLLIKSQGEWRKGYNKLASLMLKEGRIPEKDLLFFMTLDEIRDLLETRSPKIISRAIHRRKRYPILVKYIFPEIMKGFPKPVNMEENMQISSEDNFSMKGIPVSQGVVKAYVRVALTIEEAALLQPGEILLTYSTDIGWSPYFPILAGVVTELGGLISHGAVVSREYGLPCIAGLHGATRQFQTGDYVLLDGNKGILQRLPRPQHEETSF